MLRNNPYRSRTPENWNSSLKPPPVGSVVEIQNNWGVAPWYGLYRYEDDSQWIDTRDASRSLHSGTYLSWRWPLSESQALPETYVDPTGGAQDTPEYWLRQTGIAPPHERFAVRGTTHDVRNSQMSELGTKPPITHYTPPGSGKGSLSALLRVIFGRTE